MDNSIKCEPCDNPDWVVVDFDRMWGDGRVVCVSCGGFRRDYDTG